MKDIGDNVILSKSAFPVTQEDTLLLRDYDFGRGVRTLEFFQHTAGSPLHTEYSHLNQKLAFGKAVTAKEKAGFVAKFILQTFQVLKLDRSDIYYIGRQDVPLFKRCRSLEALSAAVSFWYQVFWGFQTDIELATKALVSGVLPQDYYPNIDRSYIEVVASEWYWDMKNTELKMLSNMEPGARVFAKIYDTSYEDANIFKVPELDKDTEEGARRVTELVGTYSKLRDLPYDKWPAEYHMQCFKDWADGDPNVEFGMFTVVALPFMRPTIMRGSIFNVGEGHNGKSVLIGLATSILGANNTSHVSGNSLGSWDFLVDLQTTWFNCPNETQLDFLKEGTDAFKSLSAHEVYMMKAKFGDTGVPIDGAFPMVFNINELPDFGADASAILSRMFVNNFDVDFEATGKAVKDYARKTFLSDPLTIPRLTGMALAFAHYYSQPEHLWEPSKSMQTERETLADVAVPERRYVEQFKMFFGGYRGILSLKPDYVNFGRQEGDDGYNSAVIKQKNLLFKQFKPNKHAAGGVVYTLSGAAEYPVRRFIFDGALYIRRYMGTMTMEEYHRAGNSLVYDMSLDYDTIEADIRGRSNRNGWGWTDEQIKTAALREMFKLIEDEQGKEPFMKEISNER